MLRTFVLSASMLTACGEFPKQGSHLASLPDNFPIRTVCYGLSAGLKTAVPVQPDDSSDIRLCANRQKDGHLGLDLRYRPDSMGLPTFAMVTLRDSKGRTSSDIFAMPLNPVTGGYELYLSDGCIQGAFGGCTGGADRKMQALFEAIEGTEKQPVGDFYVDLAFINVKSEEKLQWDLAEPLTKQKYNFHIPSF